MSFPPQQEAGLKMATNDFDSQVMEVDRPLPWAASTIAVYSLGALLLYFIGVAIYRLYLCPEARFPGPRIAGLTYWYEYYYDVYLPGRYIFHIQELHKRYGPIVRVNPYEIHINDPDFYHEIYHGNKWITHRDHFYNLGHLGGGLAFTREHHLHKERRDALSPYFSMQSIRALEPRITTVVEHMMARMRHAMHEQEVIDLVEVSSAFAFDVISEYAFGKEGGFNLMLKPEIGKAWTDLSSTIIKTNPFARQFPWLVRLQLSIPESVMAKASKDLAMMISWFNDLRRQIRRIMEEPAMSEARASKPGGSTMFHDLLLSDLSREDKTLQRLADEANTLVGAGGETTAQVISRTFYHILANPSVLRKLRMELTDAISDAESMPTIALLQRLPYLSAVVEEGARISLPVPARSPRVFQDRSLQYGGYTIPPGVAVSTSTYVVSTNENIFPEPFVFEPDRWHGEQGKELQKYAVSFSKGRRGCLGKKYVSRVPFIIFPSGNSFDSLVVSLMWSSGLRLLSPFADLTLNYSTLRSAM
jgi:cytochrome P450